MGAVGRSPWCRWFQVLISLWGHLADKNWPTHMQTARRDLCGGGLHSCSTTGEEIQSANHEASWAPTASYHHLSPIPPTPAFFLLFFLYLVVGVMSQALGNLDCADIVDEKEPNQQKVYSTEIHRPWTINEWQAPQKRETHYLSWIQLFISLSRFSSIHLFALVKFSLLKCISNCVVLSPDVLLAWHE